MGKVPWAKPVFNAEQELGNATFPNLRLFWAGTELSATPASDLKRSSGWLACSSNSLERAQFSAVAYFFGRELYTNLNVPVGLIESALGGTRIEPWTPPAGFESLPSLAKLAHPQLGTNELRTWM